MTIALHRLLFFGPTSTEIEVKKMLINGDSVLLSEKSISEGLLPVIVGHTKHG